MRIPQGQKRITGVAVPLGALRSVESIGIGEFPDLVEFAGLCKKIGIGLIQLLPVNDTGFQSSPYSALSAYALHPIYLKIASLPEATEAQGELQELGQRFEGAERYSYGELMEAKLRLLKKIYWEHRALLAAQAEDGLLAVWIQANPWVKEYSVYRRLKETNGGKHWKAWSEHTLLQTGNLERMWEDPAHRDEQLFWVWIQKNLDEQFSAAAKAVAEAGIFLKGDIPILMNEDSCDVWAHREYFNRELAAGAPPAMFTPLGQNWQFPIYDWDALKRDKLRWWKERISMADRYYSAYRIDHVLGFFRIWACPMEDDSAVLGRFIPALDITTDELKALGFDVPRINWLSQPHIPTVEVYDALRSAGVSEGEGKEALASQGAKVFSVALERIGSEELWRFKKTIRGERQIQALDIHPAASAYLQQAWRNRTLIQHGPDTYAPAWSYWDTRAFISLREEERRSLEKLIKSKRTASEELWETQGRELLSVLGSQSPMLACAEDLGELPECVGRVLRELGILSLRVVRWARRWGEAGEPYEDLDSYPELSVCTPAVHDSSTVREWWERETNQDDFRSFIHEPDLEDTYTPLVALAILSKMAEAGSKLFVVQIQDLLHLSGRWYAPDPESERINVPGTVNSSNWTYRLPATPMELEKDREFMKAARALCLVRKGKS